MIFVEIFLQTVFDLLETQLFICFLACIFSIFCLAGFMMIVYTLCSSGDDNQ